MVILYIAGYLKAGSTIQIESSNAINPSLGINIFTLCKNLVGNLFDQRLFLFPNI
jgi:hypothetical protein